MATNNSVDVGLSGSTGTGNFVGATSPTLVTPTLGAATATSLAFSPTTGGIIGTTAADNTTAGDVGEYVTSNVAQGSPVSLTTATAKNVTSISLTAGDWDVIGNVYMTFSVASTGALCWCSTTSASLPDASNYAGVSVSGITSSAITTPFLRVNVSTTTTVYLTAYANFASGTGTAAGTIFARRRR